MPITSPPEPMFTGYAVEPQDQCLRSGQFEIGPGRVVRITTARFDKINVQWFFKTDTDMADFRDWYNRADGANGGQAWFPATVAVGDGAGPALYDCRFTAPFKATISPPLRWTVTATLEVRHA